MTDGAPNIYLLEIKNLHRNVLWQAAVPGPEAMDLCDKLDPVVQELGWSFNLSPLQTPEWVEEQLADRVKIARSRRSRSAGSPK